MKREIKFRGKRIDNGEWVYGFLFHDNEKHWIINPFDAGKSEIMDSWHRVDPRSVGQFIGRKDDADNDLFEGDVVKITTTGLAWRQQYTYIGEVFFSRATFSVRCLDGKKIHFIGMLPDRPVEKIGNAFEHPELLGKEEKK